MSEAAKIAYRAAEIIAERGHCKNTLFDTEGRVCYIEAISRAYRELSHCKGVTSVTLMTRKILAERGLAHVDGVYFNNDPHVTGEDVILLLKECGKRLEADEVQG